MKKWPIIVAGLYGLVLLVLFGPLMWAAFYPTGPEVSEWFKLGLEWQLWAGLGVMMLMQYAMLRVPVQVASGRPVKQRSIWTTVIAAGLMMGLLVFGGGFCVYEYATEAKGHDAFAWGCIGLGIASWVFWALYFYFSTKRSPRDGVRKMQRCLWSGSVLELLIAIPTHIVARNRNYCCAGFMTFIGLTCGFSVVIFAFGPSVYFLFVERWRRLHAGVGEQKR